MAPPTDPKRSSVFSSEVLPYNYVPSGNAVISGKGKACFNHSGNIQFRQIIKNTLPTYLQMTSKMEKTCVLSSIVDTVKNSCEDCVGFVRKDTRDGRWYELSDDAAREKVGFTLRQAAKTPESKQRKCTPLKSSRKSKMPRVELTIPTNPVSMSVAQVSYSSLDLDSNARIEPFRPQPVRSNSIKRSNSMNWITATSNTDPIVSDDEASLGDIFEAQGTDFERSFFQITPDQDIIDQASGVLAI